jgi:hypothetical protein
MLVAGILITDQVFATNADRRKKIVVFTAGTPLAVQQKVVALSGSTVVQTLSFIDALAIRLPELNLDQALAFLRNYTVLGLRLVVEVYDDLAVSVLPIRWHRRATKLSEARGNVATPACTWSQDRNTGRRQELARRRGTEKDSLKKTPMLLPARELIPRRPRSPAPTERSAGGGGNRDQFAGELCEHLACAFRIR